jgi:AcrR family transcriptional regulator
MVVRMSRGEQVAANRESLVTAAREVFHERGYGGATLEAIADRAGFSKGVVYSQFAGKADLFLALLERRIADRAADNARLVAGHAGVDALRTLLVASARDTRTGGSGWARLLIEFRLVAARDPELNARYAALHARTVDRLAGTIDDALARDGQAPDFPVRTLALLVLALGTGSVLEQAVDPDVLPAGLLGDVLARLVAPA